MYSPRRLFVFGIILIVLSCLVLVRYERILGSLQPQTVPYFHDRDFMPGTHRSGAISHHDARFMPPWEHQVSVEERHGSLVGLIHSFTQFMEDKGMQSETWLAHGTLLGWFWNAKILPWDTDVDFHLTLDAMHVLAKSYNMTVYTYRDPLRQPVKTNDYLLDINYHYVDASSDVANKIDGRWIDMTNGKFIDITVVRPGKNRSILSCKDGHTYKLRDVYPLESSLMEGVAVKVPFRSERILVNEYGSSSIRETSFHWHRFDNISKIWIPDSYIN